MSDSLDEKKRAEGSSDKLGNLNIITEGLIHDFSNLLATISGLSQLSMLKTNSNELKENLATINKTAFACSLALDKMSSYIKGNYKADGGNYYIDDIINQVLDITMYKIRTMQIVDNIPIKLDICLCSNEIIRCNEYEIKRVLLNLVLNAIDAMSETGGTLKIKSYIEDGHPVVEVSDTGIGIDDKAKSHIFEPYFTTKENKGMGLGLSISKEILEKHGATIKVESEVGKGTKFTIKFPICDSLAVAEEGVNIYNII